MHALPLIPSYVNIFTHHLLFFPQGEYIPYKMEDMDWYGYEDEVTGEWICSLVVVYDPALSKMPRQRWHRALAKINQVRILFF